MKISIIVPTYNEKDNIEKLITSISVVLEKFDYEIVFVDDDSPDGTATKVKSISKENKRIRCIHRIGRRGLSSAVIEGALSSSSEFIAVIDGDLQHDETKLPLMIQKIEKENLDIVVASRFYEGGDANVLSFHRKVASKIANSISRYVTGVSLSDPMSGYFITRQEVFEKNANNLHARGFKILLDIFATSSKRLKFSEIGFKFKKRNTGVSKMNASVVWEYMMLIWSKKFGWLIPARFFSFGLVGLSGLAVHIISLQLLAHLLNISFIISQCLATFIAMTSNFFLNNSLTYFDYRISGLYQTLKGLMRFYITCGIGTLANLGFAKGLYEGAFLWGEGKIMIAGISGAIIGAVWNFALSCFITWKVR